MRFIRVVPAFLFLVLAMGCATIPPEAVRLNDQVGAGLQAQHLALIDAVKLFFNAREQELDRQFEQSVQNYFQTLAGHAPLTLDEAKLNDISIFLIRLQRQHQLKRQELQQMREGLEQKLRDNYLALLRANASVSASLASASEGGSGGHVPSSAISGADELASMFQQLDRWLRLPSDAVARDVGASPEPVSVEDPLP